MPSTVQWWRQSLSVPNPEMCLFPIPQQLMWQDNQQTSKLLKQYGSKDIMQTQQRPEASMVTHSWRASQEKIHKLHQRYILKKRINELAVGPTVHTDHIQSIKDRQQKRMPPMAYIYPTFHFQAHLVIQVCTNIRKNKFLFKTGHSPLTLIMTQHINTQTQTFTC